MSRTNDRHKKFMNAPENLAAGSTHMNAHISGASTAPALDHPPRSSPARTSQESAMEPNASLEDMTKLVASLSSEMHSIRALVESLHENIGNKINERLTPLRGAIKSLEDSMRQGLTGVVSASNTTTKKDRLRHTPNVSVPVIRLHIAAEDQELVSTPNSGRIWVEKLHKEGPPFTHIRAAVWKSNVRKLFLEVDCYDGYTKLIKSPNPAMIPKHLGFSKGSKVLSEQIWVTVHFYTFAKEHSTMLGDLKKKHDEVLARWKDETKLNIVRAQYRDHRLVWQFETVPEARNACTRIPFFGNATARAEPYDIRAMPYFCRRCGKPGHMDDSSSCALDKTQQRCLLCGDWGHGKYTCSNSRRQCVNCGLAHNTETAECQDEDVKAYRARCDLYKDKSPPWASGWEIPTIPKSCEGATKPAPVPHQVGKPPQPGGMFSKEGTHQAPIEVSNNATNTPAGPYYPMFTPAAQSALREEQNPRPTSEGEQRKTRPSSAEDSGYRSASSGKDRNLRSSRGKTPAKEGNASGIKEICVFRPAEGKPGGQYEVVRNQPDSQKEWVDGEELVRYHWRLNRFHHSRNEKRVKENGRWTIKPLSTGSPSSPPQVRSLGPQKGGPGRSSSTPIVVESNSQIQCPSRSRSNPASTTEDGSGNKDDSGSEAGRSSAAGSSSAASPSIGSGSKEGSRREESTGRKEASARKEASVRKEASARKDKSDGQGTRRLSPYLEKG